jgi:hypothetical protein
MLAPYLHLDDPWVVDVALATVVANTLDGDPLWLLLVNPASSGKTELVQMFRHLDSCAWLAEITENTLLSGLQRDDRAGVRRGGRDHSLLYRWTDPVLRNGRPPVRVMLVQDLTGLITARPEKRDAIFGQLRQVCDGRLVKTTGMGEDLVWEGYLGLFGAVTPRYEEVAELNSSLGERFLLYRPLRRDPVAEARTAAGVVDASWRDDVATFAEPVVRRASKALARVKITEEASERLISLARLTAAGRTAVPRDRVKNLRMLPEPEGPARLVKSMSKLLNGLCASRCHTEPTAEDVATLAAVARSSIFGLRLRVLEVLFRDGGNTRDIGGRLRLPRPTTFYVLEDLEAIGMVNRSGPEGAPLWEMEKEYRWMAEATGFLVATDEDPRIEPVTPHAPDIKTPITVSLKMRDREEPAAAEADSGDSGGAPSPVTSEDSWMPCRICGGRVPRGAFPEHVAKHAREWL